MAEIVIITMPEQSVVSRTSSMIAVSMLAALFKQKDWAFSIFDGIDFYGVPEKLNKMLDSERPVMICLVFWFESQITNNSTQYFVRHLKNDKRRHITCVGRGATVYCEELLKSYAIVNSVILDEFEKTVVELYEKLSNNKDWKTQRGICFLENDTVISNDQQELIKNLNSLPFGDSAYLKRRKLYPIAVLNTSRYCYGRCNFCVNRIFMKNLTKYYRARSANLVVDEIEYIYENYRKRTFYFTDNNFFGDGQAGIERAKQIAELLLKKRLKIRFQIASRVNEIDTDLFLLLKSSGLQKVFLGLESGCQSVLNRYNKGTTVEMNVHAIKILNNLKIRWEPGFILFDPLTTMHELRKNLDFIQEMKLYTCKCPTGSPLLNSIKIYKGSPIESIIPDVAWVENQRMLGEREYRILDEKANAVREIIFWYREEVGKRSYMQQRSINYWLQQNEQKFIELKRRITRWQNGLAALDIKILETSIFLIDKMKKVDKILAKNRIIKLMNEFDSTCGINLVERETL